MDLVLLETANLIVDKKGLQVDAEYVAELIKIILDEEMDNL